MNYRHTSRYLLPAEIASIEPGSYDIYPSFNAGDCKIFRGLSSLASVIAEEEFVIIDY